MAGRPFKIYNAGIWIRILVHVIIWSILFALPLYFTNRYLDENNPIKWMFGKTTLIYATLFYINYLLLVPRVFFRTRRIYYLGLVILIMGISYTISVYTDGLLWQKLAPGFPEYVEGGPGEEMRTGYRFFQTFSYLMGCSVVIILSLGLGILNRQTEMEKKQKDMEKEKLNSELAFLKSQISPHFLFNTLNNIISLIGINATDARNAVLKLSKLMRYILNESEKSYISLTREIEFMNNFIDLMKLRLDEKVKLQVDLPRMDTGLHIPPLLFIPYIENTFKHGVSYQGDSVIEIQLHVEENTLIFTSMNNIFPKKKNTEDQPESRVGLENARRRLELIFPDRHELKITQTNKEYRVYLEICLNSEPT